MLRRLAVWRAISRSGRHPRCFLDFRHSREREVLNGGGGDGVCGCLNDQIFL
jgi:hypothetical protein